MISDRSRQSHKYGTEQAVASEYSWNDLIERLWMNMDDNTYLLFKDFVKMDWEIITCSKELLWTLCFYKGKICKNAMGFSKPHTFLKP